MQALMIAALLAMQANQTANRIDIRWVFVRNHLAWKSPPKGVETGYVYVDSADLAIFYPTGEFALVSCSLNRDLKTGRFWICQGCGYSIKKGTWEYNGHGFATVKSRYVYMNVPFDGLPMPGPEIEEHWSFRGGSADRIAAVVCAPRGKVSKGHCCYAITCRAVRPTSESCQS